MLTPAPEVMQKGKTLYNKRAQSTKKRAPNSTKIQRVKQAGQLHKGALILCIDYFYHEEKLEIGFHLLLKLR